MKLKFSISATSSLLTGAFCTGAVMLMAIGVHAQTLFIAGSGYTGNIYEVTPGGSLTTYATGQGGPSGLAFNSSGDLFMTDDTDGNVYEFAPNGTRTTLDSGISQLNGGIAVNAEGDLFVDTTSSILEITPGGYQSTFASGLDSPGSVAFNAAGNLFEADQGSDNIYEFTRTGVRSTFASGLDSPDGLAFNAAGDLFATEFLGGKIDAFTPTGAESTFATGWQYAQSLAFDAAGDLYLFQGGYENTSVIEFGTNGSHTTVASGLSVPTTDGIAVQGILLPVPEPSTYALLAVGGLGLFASRRKAKYTAASNQ